MAHVSPPMQTVLKAVDSILLMLGERENHALEIVGDEFTPEQLAEVIVKLATSRQEQFVFSHSNQDPHKFVLVFQTEPRKFVLFPFHNAEERKSLVQGLLNLPTE